MSLSRIVSSLSQVPKELNPPFSVGFRPPATRKTITAAESSLGLSFPSDLVNFLLLADGQFEPGIRSNPVLPCFRFRGGDDIASASSAAWLNGVSEILENTNSHRSEHDELAACSDQFVAYGPAQYHRNVIAFTTTENSDSLVVDLEPTTGGIVGQIVMVRTQPFEIAVVAPSLRSLLEQVLSGYQDGRFYYEKKWSLWREVKQNN